MIPKGTVPFGMILAKRCDEFTGIDENHTKQNRPLW